jgi:putative ATP-binding cassette transporter
MLKDIYRQSRARFLLAVLGGLIGGLSAAALVKVISSGVAHAAPVGVLAPLFFGLCALQWLSRTASQLLLMDLTQAMVCRLRIELCQKVLVTPYRKLEQLGKARLLVILTSDVSTFTQAAQLMPSVLGNGIAILVCLGFVAWLSWQVFACLFALLLAGGGAYMLAERGPRRQMRAVREQLDTVFRHFRSLLEGTRELQLNEARATHFVERMVAPAAHYFRTLFVRGMAGYTVVNNAGGSLFYLVIGLMLFVMPGVLPQSAVVMTSLTFLLLYMIQPVGDVMLALPNLRQSSIALGRIKQLEADLATPAGKPRHAAAPDPFAQGVSGEPLIKFNGVCHQFPGLSEDHPFMLGPVDLSIEEGELVFIVGGNGSGKTTLALLLLGLYEPELGSLSYRGVEVDRNNLTRYRQHFSAVFADFHLFDEILGAEREDVAAQALHYLQMLGLSHKVGVEAGRFTTTSLSMGQRKRMALVSSYLEDRPVYLFDEWAADQDPVFKRVFYTELLPELKQRGKTVIVISHDDAYFRFADRIVKVADGKLTTVDQAA